MDNHLDNWDNKTGKIIRVHQVFEKMKPIIQP